MLTLADAQTASSRFAASFFLPGLFDNVAACSVAYRESCGKPAFVEEDVEVVLPEGLAVSDSEEFLDFAGLAGLFAILQDLRRDLADDLAGRQPAFSLWPL
jgi:hypothetical protein